MSKYRQQKTRSKSAGPGRPRKLADTMESAAAQLGVSKAVIKWAKRRGCLAFSGSRVDLDSLSTWLEQNPVDENELKLEELKVRKELLIVEEREINNANLKGELLKKSDVYADTQAFGGELRQSLQTLLIDLLPGKNAGRSADEQRQTNTEEFDRLIAKWKAWSDRYATLPETAKS